MVDSKAYAAMTELERAEAQVQILMAYLDKHDPQWRETLKSEIESESE